MSVKKRKGEGTCATCGGRTAATRTTTCIVCDRKRRKDNARVYCCRQCGKPGVRRPAARCNPCFRARGRVKPRCPDCKGTKSPHSTRCRQCSFVWVRNQTKLKLGGLIQTHRSSEMARQFARDNLDWSVAEVAARSGVNKSTIDGWLSGAHEPRDFELAAVMRVLAFEPCGNCRGLGWTDPSERRHRKERVS